MRTRKDSSQSELRESEPPTPTTATATPTTSHHNSLNKHSTASASSASTAPPSRPSIPSVPAPVENMALVSDHRPMIPEHQQQYPHSHTSQQQHQNQPHQSNINSIINPPQPGDYARPYDSSSSQNTLAHSDMIQSQSAETNAGAASQERKPDEQPQQTATVRSTKGKYSLGDFSIQRTLGTGSFGRVHLVQSRHNLRFYAVKVLKKAQVVKMKQVEHTNDERRMLQKVKHPFLITLWGTFQDSKNLYMVMDFIEGGELFSLLRKSQVCNASSIQLIRRSVLKVFLPHCSDFRIPLRSSMLLRLRLPSTTYTRII